MMGVERDDEHTVRKSAGASGDPGSHLSSRSNRTPALLLAAILFRCVMVGGYIKIWRQIQSNELLNVKPFDHLHAFLYLLLRAAWKDRTVVFMDCTISLRRGQLATTERQLSRDFGWGRRRVSSYLRNLKNCTMIDTKDAPRYSVITITNYETYQNEDDEPRHKRASDDTKPAPDPRQTRATIEEVKKEREEVKKASPSPSPYTTASAPQDDNGTTSRRRPSDTGAPAGSPATPGPAEPDGLRDEELHAATRDILRKHGIGAQDRAANQGGEA
jgi:hypothetical protein